MTLIVEDRTLHQVRQIEDPSVHFVVLHFYNESNACIQKPKYCFHSWFTLVQLLKGGTNENDDHALVERCKDSSLCLSAPMVSYQLSAMIGLLSGLKRIDTLAPLPCYHNHLHQDSLLVHIGRARFQLSAVGSMKTACQIAFSYRQRRLISSFSHNLKQLVDLYVRQHHSFSSLISMTTTLYFIIENEMPTNIDGREISFRMTRMRPSY